MPILEVEIIGTPDSDTTVAQRLADAAGEVLQTGSGRTWVKVRYLSAIQYAENGGSAADLKPVFVSTLIGQLPGANERSRIALGLSSAFARVLNRPLENIHVLFEPEAVGRIAFGGQLKTE